MLVMMLMMIFIYSGRWVFVDDDGVGDDAHAYDGDDVDDDFQIFWLGGGCEG